MLPDAKLRTNVQRSYSIPPFPWIIVRLRSDSCTHVSQRQIYCGRLRPWRLQALYFRMFSASQRPDSAVGSGILSISWTTPISSRRHRVGYVDTCVRIYCVCWINQQSVLGSSHSQLKLLNHDQNKTFVTPKNITNIKQKKYFTNQWKTILLVPRQE